MARGEAGPEIVRAAVEGKFDAIFMSLRGVYRRGDTTAFAANTRYVLEHAPCRVILGFAPKSIPAPPAPDESACRSQCPVSRGRFCLQCDPRGQRHGSALRRAAERRGRDPAVLLLGSERSTGCNRLPVSPDLRPACLSRGRSRELDWPRGPHLAPLKPAATPAHGNPILAVELELGSGPGMLLTFGKLADDDLHGAPKKGLGVARPVTLVV